MIRILEKIWGTHPTPLLVGNTHSNNPTKIEQNRILTTLK